MDKRKLFKSGQLFEMDKQTANELALAKVAPNLVPLKRILPLERD